MVCVYDTARPNVPFPGARSAVKAAVEKEPAPPLLEARLDRQADIIRALEQRVAALEKRLTPVVGVDAALSREIGDGLRLRDILGIVSRISGQHPADLLGPRRSRDLAWPRQMFCYLARQHCHHASLPLIGAAIGGRDHTTVIHASRAVAARLEAREYTTHRLHRLCARQITRLRRLRQTRNQRKAAAGREDGE